MFWMFAETHIGLHVGHDDLFFVPILSLLISVMQPCLLDFCLRPSSVQDFVGTKPRCAVCQNAAALKGDNSRAAEIIKMVYRGSWTRRNRMWVFFLGSGTQSNILPVQCMNSIDRLNSLPHTTEDQYRTINLSLVFRGQRPKQHFPSTNQDNHQSSKLSKKQRNQRVLAFNMGKNPKQHYPMQFKMSHNHHKNCRSHQRNHVVVVLKMFLGQRPKEHFQDRRPSSKSSHTYMTETRLYFPLEDRGPKATFSKYNSRSMAIIESVNHT